MACFADDSVSQGSVATYGCLQCFDAVGWAAGRASGLQKTEWWGAGVVICLERGAHLHMVQLVPLPLTYRRLTRVVLDKGPLNGCVCVCVCVATYAR